MEIRLKRAIAVLVIWSTADGAMAFENTAEPIDNTTTPVFITRENWTLEGAVEGIKEQWIEMPFIRAWAYAEAIDRYCFPAKSYTKVVGVGLEEAAKSQDRFSPGMLASAERDAADHLRGEYLACAPAIRFIEDTVVRMPELENQFTTAQLRLNDARAAIAKFCAIRGRKRSPPLKICIGGYLPD
ncbi:hypothetical protein EB232_21790 [Mesorhizobium sp. NZP2077]|nr:hypothetical protein EB232_21790 [Mesorhizobium sp. NZP2077]